MFNQYETVFIATPVLSDVQVKEAVEKFRALIVDNGGEMLNQEDWGLKKLAYPIQKKSTGFYHLFEFKADAAFLAKFETEFKRDERIIRFMTVKLDKHAAAYAAKRVNKFKAEKEN